MNQFQFTVQLEQHTPIIHFQHQQAGATLRATEVKPKLDKWVFDNFDKICELKQFDESIKEYFNYKEKKASAYKMKFGKADNEEPILCASRFEREEKKGLDRASIRYIGETPYFALQEYYKKKSSRDKENKFIFEDDHQHEYKKVDKNTNEEKLLPGYKLISDYEKKLPTRGLILKENKSLDLTIFSQYSKLLNFLEFVLPLFFICNNFGSRQTKAFGSFTLKGTNDILIKGTLIFFFSFAYEATNLADIKEIERLEKLQILFRYITEDYRHIKSGKPNFPRGNYAKSQVYSYGQVSTPGYNWDKKFFKNKILDNKINGIGLKTDGKNKKRLSYKSGKSYKFIRAILGLAENYEFDTDRGKDKYVVKITHPDIDRYASPLIWKIINDQIYLVGKEIDPNMLGKKFNISYKLGTQSRSIKQTLDTPSEFNLEDFLDHSFNKNRSKKDQNGPVPNYKKLT